MTTGNSNMVDVCTHYTCKYSSFCIRSFYDKTGIEHGVRSGVLLQVRVLRMTLKMQVCMCMLLSYHIWMLLKLASGSHA